MIPRKCLAIATVLILAGCGREARRPAKVILICIDTVRYDTWLLTQRTGWADPMKAWEHRAVRFDRAQSAAPWTVPSVASVFTGEYPLHHGAGRFASRVADLNQMPPSPLPN